MTDIDSIMKILAKEFKEHRMPVVELIEVQTKDPFKVLLATILSARTKDQTTKEAAVRLFEVVNSSKDLLRVSEARISKLIFPVGFFRQKAKYLKALPKVLEEKFGGVIPSTVEELVELPGVGRKTANLVVAVGFGKPAICVDIHVHRISNRWGYIKTKTPFESEMALRKKLALKHWINFNSFIVSFGQNLCTPISPWCSKCPIKKYCKRIGVEKSR